MNKIIGFSKYLSYNLGGAEQSTIELLRSEEKPNKQVEIVSARDVKTFGAVNKGRSFKESWGIRYIKPRILLPKYFYYEYLLNRDRVYNFFSTFYDEGDTLYTYGFWAPAAIRAFNGLSIYLIRSETDLGLNINYYSGPNHILKAIYNASEYPAFTIYRKDLAAAIKKATVIANSQYMAKQFEYIYGKPAKIIYPHVDKSKLLADYREKKNNVKEKGIVFVGDSVIKGINTVLKIAKLMPRLKFYIFSRYVLKESQDGNIIWMPWQKKGADIYQYAKVVIAPSIWQEAYGRVSREAYLLGIPVLVSNIGGLPESVDYNRGFIVDEYKNPLSWRLKISKLLS